ncbi:MAG TPA: GAF domain-containing protein [Vicinamibacterales bacterium]|nr:GAF domain-containing protein [Vicinamibacterales bacterium]
MSLTDRRTVVVLEPPGRTQASLGDALRRDGWEVLPAADAVGGFQQARQARPDAVVLPAQIPGGGLELLKRLRSSAHTALIPVVALLDPASNQREHFQRWGAQAILDDSVDSATLCAELRKQSAQPSLAGVEAPAEVIAEPGRLKALAKTGLLDTPPEEVFDQITRLVARMLDVPTVLMSLVDRNRQFFKSQVGLDQGLALSRQTPLSHSYCQWVVAGREELIIPDAREHPLLRSNPLTSEFGVGAYAGVPLHAPSDHEIGSFCMLDSKPRRWRETDLVALRSAAQVIEGIAALRQTAPAKSVSDDDFRATARAVGTAIAGAATLLAHPAKMSPGDRDDLLAVQTDLGRQLANLGR